jgi:hypothetical protein
LLSRGKCPDLTTKPYGWFSRLESLSSPHMITCGNSNSPPQNASPNDPELVLKKISAH